MRDQAEVAPYVELNPTTWNERFGENGIINTPIGDVKMGESQISKFFAKGREKEFGMVAPTLSNPDMIIEKKAPAQNAERDTKLLFIKTFIKADGKRYVNFESVTVQKDGMEVSISSHEVDEKVVKKEMQNGNILHLRNGLPFGSEWYLTETPIQEEPDLVPTSDNHDVVHSVSAAGERAVTNTSEVNRVQSKGATAPAGNSSVRKDSESSATGNSSGKKNVVHGTNADAALSRNEPSDIDAEIDAARNGDEAAQRDLDLYGIPWQHRNVYRHVGQSEVDELRSSGKIKSRRIGGKIDVTASELPTTSASSGYRVKLKMDFDKEKSDGNRAVMKNGQLADGWITDGQYTLDEVESIERRNADGSYTEIYRDNEWADGGSKQAADNIAPVSGSTETKTGNASTSVRESERVPEWPSEIAESRQPATKGIRESREDGTQQETESAKPATLLDVVNTLYTRGKEVASKLFSMKFFEVGTTPKFMQDLGLRGDKFTIRYGVIARHIGKDSSHTLTESDWEQLPNALQSPFAIAKLTDKEDAYRLYTTLQTQSGEFVVVGVDVKNAGREIEVNSISTVFGRRNNANLPNNEEVIYESKGITPEQSALLKRPDFAQYPTGQELSADKGNETTPNVQEASQQPTRQASASKEKIEDVGEKIGGARKDIVRRYADKIDLDGNTLSKMFPKPDIPLLIDAGVSLEDAASVKSVYDAAKSEYKRHKDTSRCIFYAMYAKHVLNGKRDLDMKYGGYVFTEYGKEYIRANEKAYAELYRRLGNSYSSIDLSDFAIIPRSGIKGVDFKKLNAENQQIKNRFAEINGTEPEMYMAGDKVNFITGFEYWNPRNQFETLEEAIDAFIENVKKNTTLDVPKYETGIYYGRNENGTIDYSRPLVCAKIRGFGVVNLKSFENMSEARKWLETHKEDVQQMAAAEEERLKKEKGSKKTGNARIKTEMEKMRSRVGNDYRGGQNVGAKEVMDFFGFRAIEFGNYVSQKERQDFLNMLYDSLMDLSNVIGISPRALSLGGDLAMAYGARGKSGASGHYEADRNVINITKTKGSGVLAHEWMHALDRYFSGFDKNRIEIGNQKYATSGKYSPNIRQEMKGAFVNLMKSIKSSEFYERSKRLSSYHSLDTELAARALQDYVIRRLEEKGSVNDFLSNHLPPEKWDGSQDTYPFPVGNEVEKIGSAFDNLFNAIQEKVDEETGNVVLFNIAPVSIPSMTDSQQLAFDAVSEMLDKAGIPVETLTDEQMNQLANGSTLMTVYHGSGAKFDSFDHSFMGTGEGAQAYGWGSYVTEVKGIGKTYGENMLEDKYKENRIINELARNTLKTNNGDKYASLEYLNSLLTETWTDKKRVRGQIKVIKSGKKLPEGNVFLYTVEIPDNTGNNYLDWEKSMSEEQIKMVDAISEKEGYGRIMFDDFQQLKKHRADLKMSDTAMSKGSFLYEQLTRMLGSNKAASEFLSRAGFVGISYPAQFTTGGRSDNAKNYVIFNEEDLQIKDRISFMKGKKKASETVLPEDESSFKGTVVSDADGTKVLNNLDNVAKEYDKFSKNRPWTFLGDVAKALGARQHGSKSQYATFETVNGQVVTIRLSDHNASTRNFDNAGRENGISIVISRKPNQGITNDGNARLVEFFYPDKALQKAEGKPLAEIVRSIKQALYSGEYTDTTGLAEVQEVNADQQEVRGGVVYGATVGGKIYMNGSALNPETPIHEYTHIWDIACQKNNPELWNRGVELMKQTPMWDEVKNDPNYADLQTDDEIASEVHSRLTGKDGTRILENMAEQVKNDGTFYEIAKTNALISKLKKWLSDFWYWLKDTMTPWTKEEAQRVSLDDFINMPLKDLARGTDLRGNGMTAEESRIIEEAKSNGTYMKAPNGNPTNLTERQWAQVRTKAFKEWFGDWEKAARIEKLRKSKPVEVNYNGEYELDRDSAKQWAKDNLRNTYVNSDTNETIEVSKIGINKMTSHGERDIAHLKSISSIPQMIENSLFIDELPNSKDNDKYDSYRYYVCGLKIDGVDYTAKIVVGVKGDRKYYDHRLTEIEKGKLIDNLNGLANSVAENQNAPTTVGKDTKLVSLLQTNSSKVVDENGEPRVVYHGTTNDIETRTWNGKTKSYDTTHEPFTVFSRIPNGEKSAGFFFNSDADNAYGYGYNTYDVFLNMRNPYIIDAKGQSYSDININGKTHDSYDWANLAEKSGHDGLILNNVSDGVDFGALQTATTDYVAFSPNQIKSATGNTGDFDASKPDIRFRISEPYNPETETISEFASRVENEFNGYDRERIAGLQSEIAKESEKASNAFNSAVKTMYDIARPLEKFQDMFAKQGALLDDRTDAYSDFFRSKARVSTALDEFEREKMKPIYSAISSLTRSEKLDNINDIEMLGGDKINDTRKITLYLQAKDIVEAKEKGLVDRGEEGFSEKIRHSDGVTKYLPEEYVYIFESNVGNEMVADLWSAVRNATKWIMDYQLEYGFVSQEKYDELMERQYYVPQRGFEEDEEQEREMEKRKAGQSSSVFNSALKKAKGRKTLADDPIPYIFNIAQSTAFSVEKNRTKQKAYNFVMANLRYGLHTGEFYVDDVHYEKTIVDGNLMYKPVYGYIPLKELFDDMSKRRELKGLQERLSKTENDEDAQYVVSSFQILYL